MKNKADIFMSAFSILGIMYFIMNTETLKFCKVREVKSPSRAHTEDAGIDLFIPTNIDVDTFKSKCDVTKCYPNYNLTDNYFIKDIYLKPGDSVLLPTGLHMKIPHGYAVILFNKSGIASKRHLHVGSCVIDENYQGECNINLTNVGNSDIIISTGDKIVQAIILPINYAQTEEIESLNELYSDGISDRGANGFGSSGTK